MLCLRKIVWIYRSSMGVYSFFVLHIGFLNLHAPAGPASTVHPNTRTNPAHRQIQTNQFPCFSVPFMTVFYHPMGGCPILCNRMTDHHFLRSQYSFTPFPQCGIQPFPSETHNREKALLQITLHLCLFPICHNGFIKVWLHHTFYGAILYGYCLNFFDRKATPLSIRNLSILPFGMAVPFLKSIVCPFLLFVGMVLTYL